MENGRVSEHRGPVESEQDEEHNIPAGEANINEEIAFE